MRNTPSKAAVDPITVEVVRGLLDAVTDEMQITLILASHSPMITEGRDATAAIFDRGGRTIGQATAVPVHLGVLTELGRRFAAAFPPQEARPGDVYLCNDPYSGGTHMPDFAVATPVFVGGELVGYCATMTHHQDIGGMAPGSVNVEAIDIHAEGLRLPLVRLVQAGVMNGALYDVILANSRTPRALRGDLDAQIASCRTGEKRFAAIYDKFDAPVVDGAVDALLDYAEALTRREIGRIADGRYEFEDWLDDDGVSPDAQPVRIAVAIEVSGDAIHFDFTGSAPQVRSAINNVPSSTLAVIYYAVRTLTGDRTPNNEGAYRPITYHLPSGTIVNSSYPAPVAARGMAIKRIEDVVLGAMAKALPDRMTAAHSGQYTMVHISGMDATGARRVMGTVGGPYAGGMGARPDKDGIDVTEHGCTNGSPIPVEVAEANLPVLFRRVELWQDSGGAGRWRGGLGYHSIVEWRGGEAMAQFRRERHKFAPWGIMGGGDGPLCSGVLHHADGESESLQAKCRKKLSEGDRFEIFTTGSGGHGAPRQRDPARVRDDVLDGKVSAEAAERDYGVVLQGEDFNLARAD